MLMIPRAVMCTGLRKRHSVCMVCPEVVQPFHPHLLTIHDALPRYSLSTDPVPSFPRSHAYSAEIKAYWESLVALYRLTSHIFFNTNVCSIEWDNALQKYHVVTENIVTGERETIRPTIVISAVGLLNQPKFPENLKIENFKGDWWHTAQWRHDVDLRGKRVAVVGNGCSS